MYQRPTGGGGGGVGLVRSDTKSVFGGMGYSGSVGGVGRGGVEGRGQDARLSTAGSAPRAVRSQLACKNGPDCIYMPNCLFWHP